MFAVDRLTRRAAEQLLRWLSRGRTTGHNQATTVGGVKETIRLSNVARNNVYHWYKLSTHTADEMDLSRKGILVAHRRYILIISLKRAIQYM